MYIFLSGSSYVFFFKWKFSPEMNDKILLMNWSGVEKVLEIHKQELFLTKWSERKKVLQKICINSFNLVQISITHKTLHPI